MCGSIALQVMLRRLKVSFMNSFGVSEFVYVCLCLLGLFNGKNL